MGVEEYDKERTAALIKEAREVTRELKVEVEGLKNQVARVLDGGEVEPQKEVTIPAKSSWLFWR